MIQRVLSHYHLAGLAGFGLILFMLVFAAAWVWVFRRGSGEFYSLLERAPFDDASEPLLNCRERNRNVD